MTVLDRRVPCDSVLLSCNGSLARPRSYSCGVQRFFVATPDVEVACALDGDSQPPLETYSSISPVVLMQLFDGAALEREGKRMGYAEDLILLYCSLSCGFLRRPCAWGAIRFYVEHRETKCVRLAVEPS